MKFQKTSLIVSVLSFIIILSCSKEFYFTKDLSEEQAGFHVTVYFEEFTEKFFLSSEDVGRKNLVEILTEMSLAENPSMRFVTTNTTIEIYDILGTRNTLTKAWKIFVNGKEIDPISLKKGVEVNWKSKIEFKFLPYERINLYSQP
ncbi:hypothetical protein [Leptospira sp. GIMC2001]|uniref:hypothetical protein n=1 Tax=Leptospira sp. GIMC2001 TaxID=1513297 RepID=UPI002349A260|nr:hypothetical protein [Leptospira sp. GIMC2001]WCL48251.1 hypothetical protein O4O04_13150 [Leptospira sp. GIMC2001]